MSLINPPSSALTSILAVLYFLALTRLGNFVLWGLIARDKILPLVGQCHRTGILPDKTALRRRWTGIRAIDARLTTAVVFYEGLLNGRDPAHGLLNIALHAGMQAVGTVFLIEGTRTAEGSAGVLLAAGLFAVFGSFNQLYGAAVAYPAALLLLSTWHLAFLFLPLPLAHLVIHSPLPWLSLTPELVKSPTASTFRHPLTFALAAASLFNGLAPLILLWPVFAPSFYRCSAATKQILIATYRGMPFAVAATFVVAYAGASAWFPAHNEPFLLDERDSQASDAIATIYLLTFLIAAAAHLNTLVLSLFRASATKTMVARVFDPFSTVVDARRVDAIASAAHRFLQWDEPVMVLAFAPVIWDIMGTRTAVEGSAFEGAGSMQPLAKLASVVLANVALGPGATLVGAFYLRERDSMGMGMVPGPQRWHISL